jgi:translation initiation factor 1
MRNKNPTVYSTDSGRICPSCGKPVANCICKKTAHRAASDGIVRILRDSKQRKGKTVTLITGVVGSDETLRNLLSDLKRLCGCGGTLKDGILEIQGDHRDMIFQELKKRGYTVKLAGG